MEKAERIGSPHISTGSKKDLSVVSGKKPEKRKEKSDGQLMAEPARTAVKKPERKNGAFSHSRERSPSDGQATSPASGFSPVSADRRKPGRTTDDEVRSIAGKTPDRPVIRYP
jgi:hypothetical protein